MSNVRLAIALAITCTLGPGCSIIVDGAFEDRDAAVVNDSPCATFPEGTACTIDGIAESLVCNDGLCELSVCGDGVVDTRTEMCDDGNDVDADGCDHDCTPSCTDAAECDDGSACNGVETCSDSSVCVSGTAPADGTACDAGGMCQGGTCVPAGCGNGTVDSAEECDTVLTTDGSCRSDCTWTCETDEECALMDMTVCDGVETCDVATHLCVAGTPLVCLDDDANPCTIESCDATLGCVVDAMTNDSDGDGYYAVSCGGNDCDDTNDQVNPGVADACGDNVDNDCNEVIDDGTPVWFVDCDGDSFAGATDGAMTSCDRPTTRPASCAVGTLGRWTERRPLRGAIDCNDSSASARPGQDSWFRTPHGAGRLASYDYDCDETLQRQYSTRPTIIFACSAATGCSGSTYWNEDAVPACGTVATRSFCGVISGVCGRRSAEDTVACH